MELRFRSRLIANSDPIVVGRLWQKLCTGVADAGYLVSESQIPAQRVSDGKTTAAQGFPTIDVFEREILQPVEQYATA